MATNDFYNNTAWPQQWANDGQFTWLPLVGVAYGTNAHDFSGVVLPTQMLPPPVIHFDLAPLGHVPAPPLEAAAEPPPATSRRRAMRLDGDIPVVGA